MPFADCASQLRHKPESRQWLRAKRRALGKTTQYRHALAVAARLMRLPGTQRARHIALYVPSDGELDPGPIRHRLRHRTLIWYLPVVVSLKPPTLAFYPDRGPDTWHLNRFGIAEPDPRRQLPIDRPIKPWALDLVLVPLVGFDHACQRLGMGGGFYDRCFGPVRARARRWRRPRLIGLAHECQRIPRIRANPWDVALDAIVSERHIYRRDHCKLPIEIHTTP